jgi:glycosyltransferase involved in cell wall biosynthesis
VKVTQLVCAAGPVDAVTNQALACRELYRSWGWSGHDYAPVIAPGMPHGTIKHLHERRPAKDEVVVLHYSGWADGLERAFDGSRPSLLISHNITPSRFFWEHEPVQAVHNEMGFEQLAQLITRASVVAGVSEYNAQQLRELGAADPRVIPVLLDSSLLGLPAWGRDISVAACTGAPSPTVLFVGRLVPHKRQDLVIRAFARFHQRTPDARLVLIGVPLSSGYKGALEGLAERLAPGAVEFRDGLSASELGDAYRAASVFLCLSEHEGFCIPLLEAMHFGLPVIARDAGAIGEVLGDAGVLVGEDDGIDVVAELLKLVTTDLELRGELRRRGQQRLERYDREAVATQLRGVIESLGK